MASTHPEPAAHPVSFRSPEHLNEAIRLTSRSTWIVLLGLALCVMGVVIWSFIGRLDFHAAGNGVLLRDSSEVADVVARAGGSVTEIRVVPGQMVVTGDALVSVKLDEILERRDAASAVLDAQRAELAKYDETSRADIAKRKQDLDEQTVSLQANLKDSAQNRSMLQELYSNFQSELQRGLTTRQQVQSVFDRLNGVEQSIRDMTDKLSSIKTQQIEFEDQVSRNMTDLQMKVINAEGQLKDLQVQLDIGSTIRSPVSGFVTEIATQINATVVSGQKLVVVESGTATRQLIVHAYLPIDQGKRVAIGMPAEVSPSSIDERLYGSIRGTVTKVSSLPMSRSGLLAVLGTPELVDTMMAKGAPIEVEISLLASKATADGLSWTSATSPPTPVTPGTTATSRIVVDRVQPVTLILPMAKVWTSQ